jgi:hypothetical protein
MVGGKASSVQNKPCAELRRHRLRTRTGSIHRHTPPRSSACDGEWAGAGRGGTGGGEGAPRERLRGIEQTRWRKTRTGSIVSHFLSRTSLSTPPVPSSVHLRREEGGDGVAGAELARGQRRRGPRPPDARGRDRDRRTHANGSSIVVSARSNAMQLFASYDHLQIATDGQLEYSWLQQKDRAGGVEAARRAETRRAG